MQGYSPAYAVGGYSGNISAVPTMMAGTVQGMYPAAATGATTLRVLIPRSTVGTFKVLLNYR